MVGRMGQREIYLHSGDPSADKRMKGTETERDSELRAMANLTEDVQADESATQFEKDAFRSKVSTAEMNANPEKAGQDLIDFVTPLAEEAIARLKKSKDRPDDLARLENRFKRMQEAPTLIDKLLVYSELSPSGSFDAAHIIENLDALTSKEARAAAKEIAK